MKLSVYRRYMKAATYWKSLLFFFLLGAFQFFQILRNFWLSAWSVPIIAFLSFPPILLILLKIYPVPRFLSSFSNYAVFHFLGKFCFELRGNFSTVSSSRFYLTRAFCVHVYPRDMLYITCRIFRRDFFNCSV